MRKLWLCFVAFLIATPAWAASETDTALLKKAEAYLNGITTLQAHFVQVDYDGTSHEGTLYISRPGKMRLVYDPPTQMLLVADSAFLIYVDTQTKDVTHLPLGDTPAGLLLKKDLSFTDPDVKLLGVREGAGTVEIGVTMAKDPAAGRLALVFTEAPFELRQWRVLDAQHKEVTVTLTDTRLGVKLDPKLFRYDARKSGEDRGDRP